MVSDLKPKRTAGHVLLGHLSDNGSVLELSFPGATLAKELRLFFYTVDTINKTKLIRVARNLAKSGLVELKEKKKKLKIVLTELGERQVVKDKIDELKLVKPDWWDRKWRVVLFDIPEEKRTERLYFKDKLIDLGFVRIQNSVYVHAYPCHNEIELIRTAYSIKPFVRIMVAERIESEAELRSRFNLL